MTDDFWRGVVVALLLAVALWTLLVMAIWTAFVAVHMATDVLLLLAAS